MLESTVSSVAFQETLLSKDLPDDMKQSETFSISIREEPTVDQSSPQRQLNEINANNEHDTSTQQDGIDFRTVDDIASKSERSLVYQLEDSYSGSRLQSRASPELVFSMVRTEGDEESAASPPQARPSGAAALERSAGPAATSNEEDNEAGAAEQRPATQARPRDTLAPAADASAGAQVGAAAANSDAYPSYPPPDRLSRRAAAAALMHRFRTGPPMTPSSRSPSNSYRPMAQQQQRQQTSKAMNTATVQPLLPQNVREPSPERVNATAWQPNGRTSTIMSDFFIEEEPTAVDDAPVPTPGVPRSEIPDDVVTQHRQHFPGREWENVMATSFDMVKQTVASEVATAIGVELQRVQVMDAEVTATGMTCVISVSHAPAMRASEVDEKLSSCPYEKTMMLLGVSSALDTPDGMPTPDEVPAERPKMGSKRAAATQKSMLAKKRKRANGTQGTSNEAMPLWASSTETSTAYARKKALEGLPELLVTPRTYQCRSPRPGTDHGMDRLAIPYIAASREATDGFGGIGSGRAPTHYSESICHPAHVPPQHIERGVAPLVFRPRPGVAASQQQRTMAAPTGNASVYRFNGVERTADTHSVSRRSHSRSPPQLALTPGMNSPSYQDDCFLMTQGVEEGANEEEAKKQHELGGYDDEEYPYPVAAPNPFV